VRSSFLIGKDGKIEHVWPLVRAKGHATEVLKHISQK
jgi:peroxiredoxin